MKLKRKTANALLGIAGISAAVFTYYRTGPMANMYSLDIYSGGIAKHDIFSLGSNHSWGVSQYTEVGWLSPDYEKTPPANYDKTPHPTYTEIYLGARQFKVRCRASMAILGFVCISGTIAALLAWLAVSILRPKD